MTRVHVICEGPTEEMFIKEVVTTDPALQHVHLLPALVGKPGHKGGNLRFERLLIDLRRRLLGDTSAHCTTFFDFYGLPGDFPGKQEAVPCASAADRANTLICHMEKRIREQVGEEPMRRFIPYVQMHEFEGLLFSSPKGLAQAVNQPDLFGAFLNIRSRFNTPEEINDSPLTAPSKRIERLVPGYDKPVHGSLAALEMGLAVVRKACPLFDAWLQRLALLPG